MEHPVPLSHREGYVERCDSHIDAMRQSHRRDATVSSVLTSSLKLSVRCERLRIRIVISESWIQVSLRQSCLLVGMVVPRSHVGCSTNQFCFWFLDSFFGNGWMEWILLTQTRNVGLVTKIPTAECLSAWQVLGNLEIAKILTDYVASNPQREQTCLFLSSWLGISKWIRSQVSMWPMQKVL